MYSFVLRSLKKILTSWPFIIFSLIAGYYLITKYGLTEDLAVGLGVLFLGYGVGMYVIK